MVRHDAITEKLDFLRHKGPVMKLVKDDFRHLFMAKIGLLVRSAQGEEIDGRAPPVIEIFQVEAFPLFRRVVHSLKIPARSGNGPYILLCRLSICGCNMQHYMESKSRLPGRRF